jgi:hypothetical protein
MNVLIQLRRGHTGIDALNYLLGHGDWIDMTAVQAVTELTDAAGNLIEMDTLTTTIALENIRSHDAQWNWNNEWQRCAFRNK